MPRRRLSLLAAFGSVALVAGACGSPGSPRTAGSQATNPYGANPYSGGHFHPRYPSFLPAKTLDTSSDRVLTGTVAEPALTAEGDAVEVVTPAWSVRVVVAGPVVPGEGLPDQTAYTTCTWTVTMSGASGRVPVRLADFDSIDHLGHVYRLVTVEGRPGPPPSVSPGQAVSFEVRAYEAVGEGLMRWAPDGTHIVGMWDYEVEND